MEAIRIVAEAAVEPGDSVVVQRPVYEPLRVAPLLRGARVYDWRPSPGFQFSLDELPPQATAARALFVNNPHGPSGSLMRGTYDGCARLIADEVYRTAALDHAHMPASAIETDGGVSIGDLSKPLGLGGLRIGWIASRDAEFVGRCAAVLDYFSGSVSALSSRVAVRALSRFEQHLQEHITRARQNLRVLTAFIEQHRSQVDWMPPQAGYTAFIRAKDDGAVAPLAQRMRSRGVFVLDGSVFESPSYVRIGFGVESAQFAEGLEILDEELRADAPSGASLPTRSGDVIVLAKDPASGNAKTRLAADVGIERTLDLCAAFVQDSIDLAKSQARRLYIACSPAAATGVFQTLAPGARCFGQPDALFGKRLLHAFETVIRDGARNPVLIGTDSPTLPEHLLEVAHRALATHDVVLGPAEDGGYYLIGMTTPHPSLFADIDWSTERVLSQTLARARSAGLTVLMLPHWYDVDTVRDLDRLASDPLLRSCTRTALSRGSLVEVVT
jgi:rSAM/selenodomain-associated transferase 1